MPYLYIGVREHENYGMSQSNAQVFRILNLTANSIDSIKNIPRRKVFDVHIVDLVHKFGQCHAKEVNVKYFKRLICYICRNKYRKKKERKQHNDRSNNQSAIYSNQENNQCPPSEVLDTKHTQKIPWIDSIYVHPDNTTTYSVKGDSKVHNAHTQRSHQAFTVLISKVIPLMVRIKIESQQQVTMANSSNSVG